MKGNELFFSGAFETVKNVELLSIDYFTYLCYMIVYANKGKIKKPEDIYEIIMLYYPSEYLKKTYITRYLNQLFNGVLVLNDDQRTQVLMSKSFQLRLSKVLVNNKQVIKEMMVDSLMNQNYLLEDILVYLYALDLKHTNNSIDYYGFKYIEYIRNKNLIINSLHNTFKKIDPSFRDKPLSTVLKDSELVDLLLYTGYSTIQDLVSGDLEIISALISMESDSVIEQLGMIQGDFFETFKTAVKKSIHMLNERQRFILEKRFGYEEAPLSLEETGKLLNITRERIRQIESKAIDSFCSNIRSLAGMFQLVYANALKDRDYCFDKELESMIGDKEVYFYLLIALQQSVFDSIQYNPNYHIIFDSKSETLEEKINFFINSLGDIVLKNQFLTFDDFQKSIIYQEYNLKKAAYVKKGVPGSVLLVDVADEALPNGYRIDNLEDFNSVQKAGKAKYGDEFNAGTIRGLSSNLVRMGYVLIGRGLYKNKKYLVNIPDDLLNSIITFIAENLPVVYYSTIYHQFEEELKSIGIDNQYYLKGLLDLQLPTGLISKRDVITAEKGLTGRGAIRQQLKSYHRKFTLEEVMNDIPGVKAYTLESVINDEIANGLLQFSNKQYIYISDTGVDESVKKDLKDLIDRLFASNSERFLSDRKILARLSLFNKKLLARMSFVDSHFILFSLIQYWYKDDYYMSRPFISLEKDLTLQHDAIVMTHLRQLDEFDQETVKNYIASVNIRGMFSYLNLLDSMSDDYVQIDQSKMIKKSLLKINESRINEIQAILDLMLKSSRNKTIDTTTFKGYAMFPKLNYPWNKYMLAGIIRSFFSNKYEIEYTSNMYNTTDFLIRGE